MSKSTEQKIIEVKNKIEREKDRSINFLNFYIKHEEMNPDCTHCNQVVDSYRKVHTEVTKTLDNVLKLLDSLSDIPYAGGRKKKEPTLQVQELRDSGLTQEKIAQQLGISLSTVIRELRRNKTKKSTSL